MQTSSKIQKKEQEKKTASVSSKANDTAVSFKKDVSRDNYFPFFLQRNIKPSSEPAIQRQPLDEEEESVMPKLTIGAPDDKFEQEADQVADQVQKMSEEDDEKILPTETSSDSIQTKKSGSGNLPNVTNAVKKVIQSPGHGNPVEPGIRTNAESVLGADLSNVQIHQDNNAHEATRSIHAKAFTHKNNIWLGKDQSSHDTRLMTHELAHVVQQNCQTTPHIQNAPKPVKKFSGTYIPISREDIQKELKGTGYWETLIATYYDYSRIKPVDTRFTKDPEERDAVLAVLWQSRPKRIKGNIVQTVSVPSRGAKTKTLLYKFIYQQKAKGDKKHKLSVQFLSEGAKASIIPAPTPPANFAPSKDYSASDGFPESISDYWKKHTGEHKQVYFWIDKKSGNKFDQKLTTSETYKGRKRHALFRVAGTKTRHTISFLGTGAPVISKPGTDYHSKTSIDFLIEQEQQKKGIRLGKILGLNKVPKDEKESVKYTIYQHFNKKTRDIETNVVIPIANTSKNVFYTLRFLKKAKAGTVDVEIVRVGEQKTGTKMDMDQLTICRVHGFNPRWTNINDLKKWLNTRYGTAIIPKGSTITDIIQNADKDLQSKVNTDKWFKDNYNITILNASDAETRLTDPKKHRYDQSQTVGLKSLVKSDRLALEFALQTFSKPVIDLIKTRSVFLARQAVLFKKIRRNVVKDDAGGITLTTPRQADTTIIIADDGVKAPKNIFFGGSAGVRKSSIGIFAHEFGHVIEKQKNIKRKFAAFIRKHHIASPTAYAAKNPKNEFFSEALMLYQTNPDWMKRNINNLYKWFETLSITGKPPK